MYAFLITPLNGKCLPAYARSGNGKARMPTLHDNDMAPPLSHIHSNGIAYSRVQCNFDGMGNMHSRSGFVGSIIAWNHATQRDAMEKGCDWPNDKKSPASHLMKTQYRNISVKMHYPSHERRKKGIQSCLLKVFAIYVVRTRVYVYRA